MNTTPEFETLVSRVQSAPKYAQISESLVRQITREEMKKGRTEEATIKAIRTRLHALAGAYLPSKIAYTQWLGDFRINGDNPAQVHAIARAMMRLHSSTAERLPVLEFIYQNSLRSLGPLKSVLDLACGLNPLAMPWMPISPSCEYHAIDVVAPMIAFLQDYFSLFSLNAQAQMLDLADEIPSQSVQLTLLLKTLPLLDQIDRKLAPRLLYGLQTEHLLISYPLKSLGGRGKGMETSYRHSFAQLLQEAPVFTHVQEFRFPLELVFLLSK